jgi:hypothetical protein
MKSILSTDLLKVCMFFIYTQNQGFNRKPTESGMRKGKKPFQSLDECA